MRLGSCALHSRIEEPERQALVCGIGAVILVALAEPHAVLKADVLAPALARVRILFGVMAVAVLLKAG